ncbi:hypothetical protein TSAR_013966 [Trichomalopsis sarcophagae]|uniref:Uncharacterized protein n=1 Tax=Trichomalopsis sarcophagae TaxID=543379 RepID=A0A232ENZ1_9HYME|nr:hypothetical protein TSAR_013966 [Trichomalopsis sarcophagae]
MSFNRRRWSNDLRDSLMEYQSREASRLDDSLELECDANNGLAPVDVLNDSTNISTMLASLNIQKSKVASTNLHMSEEHSACTSSTSNGSKSSDDLINFSSTQDSNNSKETEDIMNKSIQDEHSSQDKLPLQLDRLFNLNDRLVECTTLSSDTETIKLSSCDSSVQSIVKLSKDKFQSDHLMNLNERITENVTMSSDSGTIKLSSSNSSSQNVASLTNEGRPNKGSTEQYSEDKMTFQYFSSPGEYLEKNDEIWDALISLEKVLSPFDEDKEQAKSQEPPQILNRLSQKFRETPTRFTEKLVSLIEESVISESPAKPHSGDNSGISLDRMTGEFRKLCKFIEDESMPDLAPSLMNMTTLNHTETPPTDENGIKGNVRTPKSMIKHLQETPSKTFTPKAFNCFVTPKNKLGDQTPINRFTPSADKSFEYWETVCNMMCENQGSAKKNCGKTVTIPEASKISMDEMLTICERQMASLDDTVDIRSSEPCKKIEKVVEVPRSKSVCKMNFRTKETTTTEPAKKKINEKLEFHNDFDLLKECKDLKLNEKDASDVESELSEDSYQLSTRNRRSNIHQKTIDENTPVRDDSDDSYYLLTTNQRSNVHQKKKVKTLKDDFKMLPFSPPPQIFSKKISTENPYGVDDDQDCSLLMELAKRRQRCLETAQLMLEIDREDPTSGDEDKTCLETLYKLGIQDKTFADVEEDTKFINTLNHCFEYKNYIRDKSKPIINMLQKYQSPEILKKRATSVIKSKKVANKPKATNSNFINRKLSATTKSHLLDPKSAVKSLQSRTTTPAKKPLLRASSTSEKKTSSSLQARVTPRVTNKSSLTSNLQQAKSTSKLIKKPLLPELQSMKTAPKAVAKTVPKTISQPQIQPKKTITKLTAYMNMGKTSESEKKVIQPKKLTPRATTPKPLLKPQTPCSDTKPLLQDVMLSPPEVSLESQESTIINTNNGSSILCERNENVTPESQPQIRRYFVTPGKSPNVAVGRKKPTSYFGDVATKANTHHKDYNAIESPLGLYIKGTDAQFVQNAQTRTNDRLLTPVSYEGPGKSPKLKFNLASKENTSPSTHGAENIVLPTVRYQSAKKVCMTNDESPYSSLQALTPNSRTKKLLEPVENTVVIRHEGRVIDFSPKSRFFEPDMSIRAQHVAEKASTIRRKFM